ncbi:putative 2-dehydropantoate 2-reductase [Podospora aff. communis PSN243]|uniref:2-dehydropantoate 2-reductase n=1 Tax=Podospora aff. communis PSN243 TaxID=3040156 RepID=A0AAV9G4C8_9PEZI|nr:putative 2-dehydropantoate 2-reductase [Podospora aff. communis PSN243]
MAPAGSDTPIHILGIGNLGKYVAYSLAKSSPKSVTFIFHRKSLEDEWRAEGEAVTCITDGSSDSRSGFCVETLPAESPAPEPIRNLIVTTKAYMTVDALKPLRHRLNSSSSILFLQNGMGVLEEVQNSLFRNEKDTPAFWSGICSAGVYSTKTFTFVHAGRGPLLIGPADNRTLPANPAQPTFTDDMTQRLLQASTLETTIVPADVIREAQLKKLVVNAVINPLTAIFRCQNGELVDNPTMFAVAKLVLDETAIILRTMMPHLQTSFSDQTLLDLVVSVAGKTRKNTSSMLQDVNAGRKTEIDYINGYFIREALRLSVPYTCNQRLAELVTRKESLDADGLLRQLATQT